VRKAIEFLIYTTWQQVTEETIPVHFGRGLERCNQYLERCVPNQKYNQNAWQTRELRTSFLNGLGLSESVIHPLLPNYGPNPNVRFAGQQSHTDDWLITK